MSNSNRPFSVVRRRSHLLDILIPKQVGVQGYRLQAAPNFDGSFVTILTADISSGYLDPAVDRNVLQALNNPNQIRVVFDPQTFNGSSGIIDNHQFWLQFVPVSFAGAPGTASARCLVLPEDALRGDSRIMIQGSAPSGATVADSWELNLPFRTQDLSIRNQEAGTDLYVALDPGGPETVVESGMGNMSQLELSDGAIGGFLVRGDGSTANFSASFTSYLPL